MARSKQSVADKVDPVEEVDEVEQVEQTDEVPEAAQVQAPSPNGGTVPTTEAPPARKRRASRPKERRQKPSLAERLRGLTGDPAQSREEVERLAADEWWDAISPAMEKMVARVPGASSPQDAEARLAQETEELARRHAAREETRRRKEEEARAAREAEMAELSRSKRTEPCHHVFFDGPCGGSFSYVPTEMWRTHFCVNCGTGHSWDATIEEWVTAAPSRSRLGNGAVRALR